MQKKEKRKANLNLVYINVIYYSFIYFAFFLHMITIIVSMMVTHLITLNLTFT